MGDQKERFYIPMNNDMTRVMEKNDEGQIVCYTVMGTGDDIDLSNIVGEKSIIDEELLLKFSMGELVPHDEFVISFMENEILNMHEDWSNEKCRDVAERAYDIYCEGNGETEYECIEKAVAKEESEES